MGTTMPLPQRRRGPLRTLVGAVLVLALVAALLLVGTGLVVQRRLDQDGLRQRVERQVLRQTGRVLSLGALHLRLLPVPTLQADGVAFANWPGHGRPEMLSAASATAHVALLPLLHHVVRLEGVTLIRPDLLLQRDPDGSANWQMHRQVVSGGGSSSGGGARWQIEVGSVRLRDGRLSWRDALKGWTGDVVLDRLDGSGLAGSNPSVTLAGRHGAAGFDGDLATGALARLATADPAGAAWPVRLSARETAGGREVARLTVAGTATDPARGRGYVLDVAAQASQLTALDALFPHAGLPAVDRLSLRARVDDGGAGRPVLQSVSLRTGAFQAGTLLRSRWLRSLSARSLSLEAAAPGAPVALALDGSWRGQEMTLRGTAGTLSGWQAGGDAVPVSLALAVGDTRAQVGGAAGRSVSDLHLAVQAPALQRVLGVGPALTDLALSTRLQVGPAGRYTVSELRLESRELGMGGTATVQVAAHPVVTAVIQSAHADVDALRAGWIGGRKDAAGTAPPGPALLGPAPPGPAPAVPQPPAPPAQGDAVPFAALRLADLAVRLDAQEVRLDGARYRNLSAHLSVQDGRLSLAPFSVAGPAGPIAGRLDADSSARSVALRLDPSMVPAETLASLAGMAPGLAGVVELVGDLHGVGDTVPALAGSLAGQAGASLVDGSVANALLSQVVGRPVGLPDGGRTAVRCLAVPAHVQDGVATLSSLALQTSRLDVQGHGTVGLRDGRLDLHLLPRLSLGAGGASLPVHVGGTLDLPAPALDPAAPGGRFALTIGPGGPAPDLCGPALQAARFGAPGPQPGPMALDRPRKAPKPIDILRGLGLFR